MPFSQRLLDITSHIDALSVPQSFTLLAVTKGVAPILMREAYRAGLTAFGESYWQEATLKQAALSDLAIEWHFIGRLQRNKCALIAEAFDWVQSVAHWHHAELLARARESSAKPPLNICVQVNLNAEPQKDGVAASELVSFIRSLAVLPALRVRGLMYIPPANQPPPFDALMALFRQVSTEVAMPETWDTVSMGMSNDYPAALLAGSTLIRIGSKLFKEE